MHLVSLLADAEFKTPWKHLRLLTRPHTPCEGDDTGEGYTQTRARSAEDGFYVLSLVFLENNSDILSNVARSAEWKSNSFLKKKLL